jgi:endonuclease/exonuclease/phosphatase family metal-dependent hydrolase
MISLRAPLAAALIALAAPASADGLRIASWNIEHLAAENDEGCAPRDDAGFARVAQVIDKVGADIWLLQEIKGAAALARVFPPGWTFHVEGRPETTNGPPCRGNPGQRLRHQATAIAVRPGLAHDRLPDLDALDVEGWGFLRWGTAIALPDHAGLQILNVHLKSGCFEDQRASACQQLFAQVPVVAGWMREVHIMPTN